MLASHAVKYLADSNVETVGLYAYIDKIPFYKRLGFEYDSDFVVLKGKGVSSPTCPHIIQAKKADIQNIIDNDRSCWGFSRSKLLEPILLDSHNLCYISIKDGGFSGYVIAKIYHAMEEVGPLISHQRCREIAVDLLSAILNRLVSFEVSMCIHEKRAALLDMLKRHCFSENFRVARMLHGSPIDKSFICLAESLERG
jgi:hypothetical protein